MTLQGTIILDLIALALLLWILSLVRADRLYVGYGTVLIILIVPGMAVVSITPLVTLLTRLVGAVFPVSALTLVALCFIAAMLVYVLSQLTIISNRLSVTVQELAILRASSGGAAPPPPPGSPGPGEPVG